MSVPYFTVNPKVNAEVGKNGMVFRQARLVNRHPREPMWYNIATWRLHLSLSMRREIP